MQIILYSHSTNTILLDLFQLRDSQADCTDTDCTTSTVTGESGNSNLMLIAMAWGLLAMFMFFLRPSSMRSGGQNSNGEGQLEGKPTHSDDNDGPVNF